MLYQIERFGKVLLCFTGKPDDDIGRNLHIVHCLAEFLYDCEILLAGILAVHTAQNLIRPALKWQMHMMANVGQVRHSVDYTPAQVFRMRGHKPNPLESLDTGNPLKQVGKIRAFQIVSVGVDVLAKQGDLTVSFLHEPLDFRNN
ncbi:hypothetical protein SDC9_121986 [bioreactor metagenome]|uniref:Uncharacterized protein n=1 Tax=bioreactor metagenome TaxID=1076179 RepID=A0A645CDL5_9ZZZZ